MQHQLLERRASLGHHQQAARWAGGRRTPPPPAGGRRPAPRLGEALGRRKASVAAGRQRIGRRASAGGRVPPDGRATALGRARSRPRRGTTGLSRRRAGARVGRGRRDAAVRPSPGRGPRSGAGPGRRSALEPPADARSARRWPAPVSRGCPVRRSRSGRAPAGRPLTHPAQRLARRRTCPATRPPRPAAGRVRAGRAVVGAAPAGSRAEPPHPGGARRALPGPPVRRRGPPGPSRIRLVATGARGQPLPARRCAVSALAVACPRRSGAGRRALRLVRPGHRSLLPAPPLAVRGVLDHARPAPASSSRSASERAQSRRRARRGPLLEQGRTAASGSIADPPRSNRQHAVQVPQRGGRPRRHRRSTGSARRCAG